MRGDVEFSNDVVSDPIVVRSSGMPVYNYVVVIDDGFAGYAIKRIIGLPGEIVQRSMFTTGSPVRLDHQKLRSLLASRAGVVQLSYRLLESVVLIGATFHG